MSKIAITCVTIFYFSVTSIAYAMHSVSYNTSEIYTKKQLDTNTLSLFNYDKLIVVKKAIRNNDDTYLSAYNALLSNANKALNEGPFSVMQKKRIAVSDDKHDYLSLAPYWWPDPNKKDGLPWFRKDGEINPLTRGKNVDEPVKDMMLENVKVLSLAYFFSNETKYAQKTKELLKVWFVDKATRMNPNLNFAQGIPGINEGRGFGIIEFAGITHVITAIEILELEKQLDVNLKTEINNWLSAYLKWLQTSEFGIFEKTRKNNHGSMYDVQIVSLLLYFNRINEAKKVLLSVIKNRIEPHIDADGSQPHELQRTKTLTYSILNLSALTKLAFLGQKKGINIDLWNYQSANGDIKKAYDYLLPFLNSKNKWPYQQLGSMDSAREKLCRMFATTGSMFTVDSYCSLANNLQEKTHLNTLLHPCLP